MQALPYLFPYHVSYFLSLAIAIYAYNQRRFAGASAFALFAFGQGIGTFLYTFEIAAPTLEEKLFWDNMQWVVLCVTSVLWRYFSLVYAGAWARHMRATFFLLALPTVIFAVLLVTEPLHNLIHDRVWLVSGVPFDALYYDFTPPLIGIAAYIYFLFLLNMIFMGRHLRRQSGIQRIQIAIIMAGLAVPMIGALVALATGITFGGQRDVTPVLYTIGNGIVAWGLFRYRLLDIRPVAREYLVEKMTEVVVVVDLDNHILDMNETARQNAVPELGDNLIGQHIDTAFPQWQKATQAYTSIPEARSELTIEVDGKPLSIDLQISPIHDRHGKQIARLLVARDITDHALLRDALVDKVKELALAQERFDELVNNLPGMAYIFIQHPDNSVAFEYVSARVREVCGLTPEQVYADPMALRSQIEQPYRDKLAVARNEAIDNMTMYHVEVPKIINGEVRWHEFYSTPKQREDGTLAVHGIEMDITERKRIENELRETQDRFKSAFEFSPIGITLVSTSGEFMQVNRQLCDMLGYSEAELLSKRFHDITHPEDLTPDVQNVTRLLAGEITSYSMEKRYYHKSGRVVWVQLNVSLVRDPDGQPLYFISQIQDISERRRKEHADRLYLQVQTELQKEQELSELKTQMMIRIGHEFRTPLTIIRTAGDILQDYLDRLSPEKRKEKIGQIFEQVNHLTTMLDDISFIVRGQAADLELSTFRLDEMCEDIAATYKGRVQVMTGDVHLVHADRRGIRTIITELVQNALKYSQADTPILIDLWRNGADLRLRVIDRGIGIPLDDQRRLFDPFFRAGNVGEVSGLGLGLTIVQDIVKLHGGVVYIDSSENDPDNPDATGTQVTVQLPGVCVVESAA